METRIAPHPVVDWNAESELVTRAASPPVTLFPLLNAAAAMWPLMLFLSALPLFWLLARAPLTDASAQWGQAALVHTGAEHWQHWWQGADPALPPAPGCELPPWSIWIVSLLQQLPGLSPRSPLMWASAVSLAGTIFLTACLAQRWEDDRTALLTTLFLATSPVTLGLAQTPSVGAMSSVWMLATFWFAHRHFTRRGPWYSWNVVLAGLCLGISFLAGGPLGLVVAGLLLPMWSSPVMEDVPRRPLQRVNRQPVAGPGWKSGWLIFAIGLLVGGWWIILQVQQRGTSFWQPWCVWLPLPYLGDPPRSDEPLWEIIKDVYRELVWVQPFAMGFVGLGLTRSWNAWLDTRAAPGLRRNMGWLLCWLLTCFVLWLGAQLRLSEPMVHRRDLWEGVLLPPLCICGAIGLRAVVERRVSFRTAFAACLISAVIGTWRVRGGIIDTEEVSPQVVLGIVLLAAGLGTIYTLWRIRTQENRQRWLLSALVLVLVAANSLIGMFSVPSPTSSDRELMQFWRDIRDWQRTESIVAGNVTELQFVTESPLPPTLEYTVSALWRGVPRSTRQPGRPTATTPTATPPAPRTSLLIVWGTTETFRSGVGLDPTALRPLGVPRLFRGRQLQAILANQ